MHRGEIVRGLEESASSESDIGVGTSASIVKRLHQLGLDSVEMAGDGNCQFRAIADNLFGSQSHHAVVREAATRHMKKHASFFGIYFEAAHEFHAYLRDMGRSRTWGDELTLRAIVDGFGVVAHLITSDAEHWHSVYAAPSAQADARVLFLAYIAPIHYNTLAMVR